MGLQFSQGYYKISKIKYHHRNGTTVIPRETNIYGGCAVVGCTDTSIFTCLRGTSRSLVVNITDCIGVNRSDEFASVMLATGLVSDEVHLMTSSSYFDYLTCRFY